MLVAVLNTSFSNGFLCGQISDRPRASGEKPFLDPVYLYPATWHPLPSLLVPLKTEISCQSWVHCRHTQNLWPELGCDNSPATVLRLSFHVSSTTHLVPKMSGSHFLKTSGFPLAIAEMEINSRRYYFTLVKFAFFK